MRICACILLHLRWQWSHSPVCPLITREYDHACSFQKGSTHKKVRMKTSPATSSMENTQILLVRAIWRKSKSRLHVPGKFCWLTQHNTTAVNTPKIFVASLEHRKPTHLPICNTTPFLLKFVSIVTTSYRNDCK